MSRRRPGCRSRPTPPSRRAGPGWSWSSDTPVDAVTWWAGWGGACRAVRRSTVDDLAGIEDSVRIEGVPDRDVQVGDGGGDLGNEAVALEQADAVLAGDRAADRERGGDDLGEGQLGTVAAASSPGLVMMSGCRLPS